MNEELQANTSGEKVPCTLNNLMAGIWVCLKAGFKISRDITKEVREWWKKDASKDVPQAIVVLVILAVVFGIAWFSLIATTQLFYWVGIIKMAIIGADINLSESLYFVDAFSRKNPLEGEAINEGIHVLGAVFCAVMITTIVIVGGKILCAVGQDDKKSAKDSLLE